MSSTAPTSERPANASPAALANPHVAALSAYTPGEQPEGAGWVKLNTNENPYPPSPRVVEAIQRELADGGARLRLYPPPASRALREALAALHGVPPEWVLAGNGSDDVLNLLVRVFCGPGRAAGMTVPSYSLYSVLVGLQDAPLIEVPFGESFALDPARIAQCGANIFFLTSPNAPGGAGFATADIAAIARDFPGVLVVDEAYAVFADEDAVRLVAEFPRVVIARTFSKSHSLAGLRVGYALARPEIISLLDRVRDSYNLDRLAQVAAVAALAAVNYYQEVISRIVRTRRAFQEQMRARGWPFVPSQANFVLATPVDARGRSGPEVAEGLFDFLKERRILVRRFPNHPLTRAALRISIGADEDMAALAAAFDLWLKHDKPR